jgi:hypothetical protein
MFEDLKGLEHWFVHVIEPLPVKRDYKCETTETNYKDAVSKWLTRESIKVRGYTFYCKSEVRSKVYVSLKEQRWVTNHFSFIKKHLRLQKT